MTSREQGGTGPIERQVVAVFNSSDDLVEMIRILLEHHGFVAITGHVDELRSGKVDLEAFTRQFQPSVVVYDLPPPYDRHWAFLDMLRTKSPLHGVPFVVTCTNAKVAQELAGRNEPVIQIVGRPFEFDELLAAVRAATGHGSDT